MNKTILVLLALSGFFFLPVWPEAKKSAEVNFEFRGDIALVNDSLNVLLGDTAVLYPFYEKLYRLKTDSDSLCRTVSVFHLGNSHIQAGFLNGTVMKNFHTDFGNAGRGLIIPLRLAKTNEPTDYAIVSSSRWMATRCITRNIDRPLGLGGLSLAPESRDFRFEVKTRNRDSIDYQFTKIQIFHHPGFPELKPEIPETDIRRISDSIPFLTTFELNRPVEDLVFSGRCGSPDSTLLFGMSLESGRRGVLYHAVGMNGAQFLHFAKVEHLDEQIRAIHPDIFIFTFGTNEALRPKLTEEELMTEMDEVIDPIVRKNPGAVILLTTPAECKYRQRVNGKRVLVPNPRVEKVRDIMMKYALQKNYACWDFYSISGGKNASKAWAKKNLLARDGVHYSVSGYELQGNLLYQAIIKGYNGYVDSRHQ